MTPEHWQQVKRLFDAALERDAVSRNSFLSQACGGDGELQKEVEKLLAAHEQAGSFMAVTSTQLSRAVEETVLAPNAVDPFTGRVLSHYRIEARLGSGGMGVVYRATDLKLGRAVAIKLLSRQVATNEDAKARFLREARAASALDHPNIGAIYELGEHDGEHFIAMALYEGESLKPRLEKGALVPPEAIGIFRQIASGLEAAHRAGIVHRDVKPANVMVTSSGTVKILDFGLAKLLLDSAAQSVTQAGEALGTLLYMSPEQLKGEAVDHRTDLWSLGVLGYELVSGVCPFETESKAATAHRILHEEPPSLAAVPGVPSGFALLVTQLLRKDPAQRLPTATEVLERIEDGKQGLIPQRRTKSRRSILIAAVLLLIALAGSAIWIERTRTIARKATGSESTTPHRRRAVAVLGLNDLSQKPESAWLSTALSEMLISELGVGERLRVISGESVAQMKRNLNLTQGLTYSEETLQRIRKLVDADFVVFGSYLLMPDKKLRMDLRLQEAAGGKTHLLSDAGTEGEIFDLVSRVGNGLRRQLGLAEASEGDAQVVRSALPSNPEAARLYAEGLVKLRAFDALAARGLLERAIQIDPDHSLAHSALSTAWSLLGYDERARLEGKKAFELSTNLSREDKLSVEARYRLNTKEFGKAIDIYKALFSFFPDNLEFGLRLGEAQIAAGKANESLLTVESLRKLPPPASGDPRIDLLEAGAARATSDYKRQLASAEMARAKAAELKAPPLTARALGEKGFALGQLGEKQEALSIYHQAKELSASIGDKPQVAFTAQGIGIVLQAQGDYVAAKEMFEEALAIRRETGDQKGIASSVNGIAVVLWHQGDLAGATKLLEQALAINREIDNKSGISGALGNIGTMLKDQGDLAGAKEKFQEALALQRDLGMKSYQAISLGNLADLTLMEGNVATARKMFEESLVIRREIGAKLYTIQGLPRLASALAAAGDLAGARQNFEEAIALSKQTQSKSSWAEALSGLGEILHAEGNLVEARRTHEEALSIRNAIGEKEVAESRLELSKLLIDEGRFAEAESLARQVAEETRTRIVDLQAEAERVVAASLLARGKFAEARSAVARASALLANSENRRLKLAVAITTARVEGSAQRGSAQKALRTLREVIAEATKGGSVDYQLEARLALGEMETHFGNLSRGRQQLQRLEKDAREKGFILIANKAVSARGKLRER